MQFRFISTLCAAVLCASAQQSSPATVAFTGARLITAAGPDIADGVVVIQGDKIAAAGAAGSVQIPAGAKRIDVSGRVIMPGIVDTHSHIGEPEGGDSSAPIQPDARVLDSINVRSATIEKARAGGVTAANVMSGSGHLLSGQTLYLKLRKGNTIDDYLIHLSDGRVAGGIKMANGTNPRRDPPFPGTRAKSAALDREEYIKAQEYRDKIRQANGDLTKLPPRDLGLEALEDVLDGKRTVQFHTHRQDDIMTAIRLSQEFHFHVVLHHVSEGWMVANEIAKAGVPCSVIELDSPGGKLEAKDVRFETPAILYRAGVLVAIHTDDPITDSRLLLRSAALAIRGGLPRDEAVNALTINGARMLGLEQRVGSLKPGKDADLVVLSGDPFSVYTHVLETWVEGRKVFDRSDAKDRLYAVGGYGASHDQGFPDLDGEEDR
ncbi:MAG TPA: amidohydrolase family protein [Bryobacteraceae bacterium]|nr:amidohydrolase family protein [Bryobacteraceae bacterium]